MLKTVIVDDEPQSRKTLAHMIEAYCSDIKVLGMAFDVLSAVKEINTHQPDLVFLDIEMPHYSGFKLIECFEEINFDIVFTTAYEAYAVKAFKVSAAGYLLKPIDIDELVTVVRKIKQRRASNLKALNIENILQEQTLYAGKITLPARNSLLYINIKEIVYLKSDGRNTDIHLIDGSKLTATENLKNCIEILGSPVFIRIHKSFVINILHINKYTKGRDSYVLMENNIRIDIGNIYKEELSDIVSFFLK